MTEALSGWDWRCLARAPHRLAFAAACLLLLLASLWWWLQLAVWTAGPALPTLALAPALAHGAMMVFGFFPLCFLSGVIICKKIKLFTSIIFLRSIRLANHTIRRNVHPADQ